MGLLVGLLRWVVDASLGMDAYCAAQTEAGYFDRNITSPGTFSA
jgi:hypothetical protein